MYMAAQQGDSCTQEVALRDVSIGANRRIGELSWAWGSPPDPIRCGIRCFDFCCTLCVMATIAYLDRRSIQLSITNNYKRLHPPLLPDIVRESGPSPVSASYSPITRATFFLDTCTVGLIFPD